MKYVYIVMGLALMAGGIAGAQGGISPMAMGLGLLFSGGFFGWQGMKAWRRESSPALDWNRVGELEEERMALLQESYEKAVADCACIEEARRRIRDVELSRQLGKMQQVAGNMLRYLEKNPQKLPLAQRFIDYYQDRAVLLVQKYQEFEATELQTGQIQEMKERMKTALGGLDEAYEEQFERILSDQFVDLDAEIKVMQQTMDAEGIQADAILPSDLQGAEGESDGGGAGQLSGTLLAKERQGLRRGRENRTAVRRSSSGPISIIPKERQGDVLLTKLIQSGLAIVLGSFGAHKFYQGKTTQGVLYCLFFWTFLPGLIGFFEGVRYLCMKMDDFYEEYYMKRLN